MSKRLLSGLSLAVLMAATASAQTKTAPVDHDRHVGRPGDARYRSHGDLQAQRRDRRNVLHQCMGPKNADRVVHR